MKARLKAGVEFDFLTQEELRKELDPVVRALEALEVEHAILKRFAEADTINGSGSTLTIEMDGPPAGFLWDIRRIVVSGADPEAPVGGSAYFYRNTRSPLNLLDFTTSIPAVGPWSKRQISLFGTEKMIVRIVGAPASTRIFISGQAWQTERTGLDVPGED